MSKYDNYSPNIPNTDEPQDIQELLVAEDQPQPTEQPARRRRRPKALNSDESRGVSGRQQEKKNNAQNMDEPGEPMLLKLRKILTSPALRIVVGIILGGIGFWLAVAFLSFLGSCIADQSAILSNPMGQTPSFDNDAGEGGARLTELLINQGFGLGAVVIVVWLICMSLKLLVGYPRFRTLDFTIKSIIAMITVSVVVGMLCIGLDTPVNWGGFHGRYINERIYSFIGWSGAFILSIVLIAIFVVICLRDVIKWILKKKREYDERRRIQREAEEAERQKEAEIREMQRREVHDQALSGEGMAEKIPDVSEPGSVEFDPESDTIFDIPEDPEDEEIQKIDYKDSVINEDILEINEEQDTPDTNPSTKEEPEYDANIEVNLEREDEQTKKSPEEPKTNEEEKTNPKESADSSSGVMTVNVNQIEKGNGGISASYDTNLFTHEYKFPPSTYLRPGTDKISVDADEQIENKEKIRKTLLDFGIPITSIEATVGPTVTLYEIRPDTGVKIAKIRNLVDDIALSLAAIGVRIIAPIPGKGTVGIEVANKDPLTVSMRTIIQSKTYQEKTRKFKLPVALGSTISNEVYITDLAKMPHLLVAGATGQGKSVGLNAIITSLLYSKRPEELKFVMVDPKRVEFSLYSKIEKYYLAEIPNSEQPIITNMENVVATLSSLCVEMDERYKLLEKAYVRQVSEYNEKFKEKKLDPREGHRFMPYIVVIIDEFADLIMTAGKEVEIPIARLAQLARAIGIHVIIATQRPSTNVITGMIKANFPVRIAFKVSSGVDSKTILDSTGAQQLIGRGDMLISNNGEMIRVQCAFVDTPEVEEVCDYIARQPYPQGAYILPEPQMAGGEGDASEIDAASLGKKDPLLEEVARQVVMSGTASTSAVQRRYEIGYNRAGRIMDQLQAFGIVGPATGGKPRDVLVDPATLESILASV
ncbi:MAG: DNA translocase FtsK [Muribaculum sp.]|nr:DNA translocase FtsK [Muribaculum sp.]